MLNRQCKNEVLLSFGKEALHNVGVLINRILETTPPPVRLMHYCAISYCFVAAPSQRFAYTKVYARELPTSLWGDMSNIEPRERLDRSTPEILRDCESLRFLSISSQDTLEDYMTIYVSVLLRTQLTYVILCWLFQSRSWIPNKGAMIAPKSSQKQLTPNRCWYRYKTALFDAFDEDKSQKVSKSVVCWI